ncbi:MAG: hypothetical protein U5L07_12705 [Desulfobacterales bacterium]|nr:hypothetical protein [Desulfobacterales bacterium]
MQRIDAFDGDAYQRYRVLVQTAENTWRTGDAYILRPSYIHWLTDER